MIQRRRQVKIDFRVTPLSAVSGRVYSDKNGNGRYDPGEGLRNIVLHLEAAATVTSEDGTFAFYNVQPGKHTIRLDADRLPKGFVSVSPAEVSIELPPDRSVNDVRFQLEKRDKPILFQTLP